MSYYTKIAIQNAVEDAYLKAEKHFGRTFKRYEVTFKTKGTTAGWCKYKDETLDFNLILAEKEGDSFVAKTPAHEVCHAVVRELYGRYRNGKKVMPHGKEWKFVMSQVMGLEPSRCHSYDTSHAQSARLDRSFKYECACRTHCLTKIRHNKIKKGAQYRCMKCKSVLKLA